MKQSPDDIRHAAKLRQRKLRRRQREERELAARGEHVEEVVVRDDQIVVVLDRGPIADALRDANRLKDWDIEDRAAVQSAFVDFIAGRS